MLPFCNHTILGTIFLVILVVLIRVFLEKTCLDKILPWRHVLFITWQDFTQDPWRVKPETVAKLIFMNLISRVWNEYQENFEVVSFRFQLYNPSSWRDFHGSVFPMEFFETSIFRFFLWAGRHSVQHKLCRCSGVFLCVIICQIKSSLFCARRNSE